MREMDERNGWERWMEEKGRRDGLKRWVEEVKS